MTTITAINAMNAGYFSELAYQAIGTQLLNSANFSANTFSGWNEVFSIPTAQGTFNLLSALKGLGLPENAAGVFANQFRILTNGTQYVFAFKGSSEGTNWVDDLKNSGSQAFATLEPVVEEAIQALQDSPTYGASFNSAVANKQVFTDGHSLGGGLAQSFGLLNSFNGYGQNSLPISSPAAAFIDAKLGNSYTQLLTAYRSQQEFIESNTDGDIATLYYSTLQGQKYLDATPTTIPSPFSSSAELALIGAGIVAPGPVSAATLLAAIGLGGAAHMIGLNTRLSQQYGLTANGHLNVPIGPGNSVLVGDSISASANNVTVTDASGDIFSIGSTVNSSGTQGFLLMTAGSGVDTFSVDPATGDLVLESSISGALFRDAFDSLGNITESTARYSDGASYVSQVASNGSLINTINDGSANNAFTIEIPSSSSTSETTVDGGAGNGFISIQSGSQTTKIGQNVVSSGSLVWTDSSGTTYSFAGTEGSSLGTLIVQNGLLDANSLDSIVIDNFDLSMAEGPSGFMGIHLPGSLYLGSGENIVANRSPSTFVEGSSDSYTLSVDAPSMTSKTITVSLSGAVPSDFEASVGDTVEKLNPNGTFIVSLAAGETNVAFTLIDVTADNGSSDIASGANLQLSASLPNPDTLVGGTIQTTPLPFSYIPEGSNTAPAPLPTNVITGTYNSTTGITTYNGDGGDDYITATGTANLINAQNSGNDSLVGGSQANTINGGSGNSIYRLSGTDTVSLGTGFNTVYGSSGHDIIEQGGGDNLVNGNGGTDLIVLGGGNSQIYAGTQTSLVNAIAAGSSGGATGVKGDFISVLDGNNTVVGGNGNDLINVGAGNDVVVLGPGNDSFLGGVETSSAVTTWTATVAPPTGSSGYVLTETGINFTQENFANPYPQPYNGEVLPGGGQSGPANDSIYGGSGNDFIVLGNGNNYVSTGNGNDTVSGGMGNDSIFAGSGADFIRGGGGTTYIAGGSGSDTIAGGDGNNTIIGGSGNSTIEAANGPSGNLLFPGAALEQNYVNGGSGNDVISGSAGQDTLIAGTGNTTVYGGTGRENITGGAGNDLLVGGAGNDTLAAGGAGADSLYANGSSSSTTVVFGGTGTDYILGGSGANTLNAGDGGVAGAATSVFASQSDPTATTTIYGGLGLDFLEGGTGSAAIYAGDGGVNSAPTTLIAGTGTTTLYGGLGTDILQGGSGNDVLYAGDGGTSSAPTTVLSGSGASTLNGGAGPSLLEDTVSGVDVIQSGTANDTMIGIGSDTLVAGSGNDLMQANGGSVTFEFNPGFGNDTILSNGGTENLDFGSGILATDFTATATSNGPGFPPNLVLTGDGGSLVIEGGLNGDLVSSAYVDPSSIPLPTLLTDVFGGDQTIPVGNTSLIVNLANNENVTAAIADDTVSSWGNNVTINGASGADSIYSTGSAALIASATSDMIVATGSSDTLNGAYDGGDSITLSGSKGIENIGSASNASYLSHVTISGANDTVNAAASSASADIAVNAATTVINVASGAGIIAVSASVSYTAPTNVSTLTLIGSGNIAATGNSIADLLTGGSGTDTLIAGTGIATLVGGSGNTTFVINSTNDVIEDSYSTAANTIQVGFSYTLPNYINTLSLTGTSALVGHANASNDTLISNSGVDTLVGGIGNDVFILNNAADVVQDTVGSATIIYTAAANFSLPNSINTLTLQGTAAIHATGNAGNDLLTANSGADTLSAGSGLDTLVSGTGSAIDSLVGGTGSDLFIVSYSGDIVSVGSSHGTDTIQSSVSYSASANVADLQLTGSAALAATGNALANILTANSGADTLTAGVGLATLVGGTGNDVFVVTSTNDVVSDASTTSSDTIESSVSYSLPVNVNVLILTGTSSITGSANGGNDTLTTNSGVDTLYGGAGNDVFVISNASDIVVDTAASAVNIIESSANYSLPTDVNTLTLLGTSALKATGNAANDVITANTGADTLVAGSGADTLISGTGTAIDSLVGGTGSDLFVVNYAGDVVTVGTTHGADSIKSSVSYTLPTNVNTLTLSGSANLSAAALTGNNVLIANAGNDTLRAGSGADTLVAGTGVDTLVGGTGPDTFSVNSTADVLVSLSTAANTVESTINYTVGAHISTLVLEGNGNLVGTGNSSTSSIFANGGMDTLISGTGTTDLIGGAGADLFIVNSANDIVNEANPAKAYVDTIQSSVSYALPSSVDVLVLTGSASLTGSANGYADELVGNAGTDTLTAGAGNDTLVAGSGVALLIGGKGNNTFVIDSASDTIQETVTGHNNVLFSSVSYSLPTNVNTLTLTGSANLTATANSASDAIRGNAGADVLKAGTGTDTLTAGSGLATLIGSTGNDTFVINNAADVIQSASAGAHNSLFSSVTYTLPTNVTVLTLTGIANIAGTGNTVADTLSAGAGQDTLVAGTGVATLIGGAGNDTFVVNSASDVVQDTFTYTSNTVQSSVNYSLGANVNSLTLTGTGVIRGTANGSTDTLSASLSGDTLVGGAGSDTFVVTAAGVIVQDTTTGTANTVQSSVSYSLTTNVNTLLLTGTGALKGAANAGADTLVANSGADTLVGGSSNDLFVVNSMSDVVQDTFTGTSNTIQSSSSYSLPTNVNALTLTGTAALSAIGNAGADLIQANNGADTLTAGSGVATLVGGSGNTTFVINNAQDVVQDAFAMAANTVEATVSYSLGANVNSLVLNGTSALIGTANSGNDTIISNSGVDTLVAGTGNDVLVVNNASDIILNATANDTIESSVSLSLPTNVNDLVLIGSGNIEGTGNANSNILTAGSGNDSLVAASVYTTTLIGGSGNDTFVVNSSNDIVQDTYTTTSNAIVSSAVSYTLPVNVDSITLNGSSFLQATGNSDVNNVFNATTGTDVVTATATNNTIIGGAGADSLYAGPGSNVIYAGSGGTSYTPTYVYGNANGTNSATQSTIYGGSGAAVLEGGPGTDVIYGGSGADSIFAGTGFDTLHGGPSNVLEDSLGGYDQLIAGAGNETLEGIGADTLVAGTGNDVLYGDVLYGSENSSSFLDDIPAGFGQVLLSNEGPFSVDFGSGIEPGSLSVSVISGGPAVAAVDSDFVVLQDGPSAVSLAGALAPGLVNNVNFADTGTQSFVQFMNTYGPGYETFASNYLFDGEYLGQFYVSTGNGKSLNINTGPNLIWASGSGDSLVDTGSIYNAVFAFGNNDTVSAFQVWAGGNDDLITVSGGGASTLVGSSDTLVAIGNGESFIVQQSTDQVQAQAGTRNDSLDAFFSDTLSSAFSQLTLDSSVGGLSGAISGPGGTLIAGATADTLTAGTGADTLVAQGASDVLIGGPGADTYVLTSATDSIQFGTGAGSLNSVQADFSYALSSSANSLTISSANAVGTGNSGNDYLRELGSDDTLVAGSGTDTLVALSLNSTLVGGSGNDTFVVSNPGDVIIDTATAAANVVEASNSYSLSANVNTLILTGPGYGIANNANDSLVGTTGSDSLVAGSGNDTVIAGSGQDTLTAGTGNGTLVAGSGIDTFVLNSGFTHDQLLNAQQGDMIEFGSNIAESSLTFSALLGTGGALPSLVVTGAGGAVTVQGGLVPGLISSIGFANGSSYTIPQLFAPTGRTTLSGSQGNLILSTNNNDTVVGGSGKDTVEAWGSGDTLTAGTGGTEIIAGGFGDRVVGGAGTDSLDAIGAQTTLVGGTGTETFVVNNASALVQASAAAHNTVLSSVTYTVPTNVSILTAIGSASLIATGNAVNDTITGNIGSDTLVAGSGVDKLIGGGVTDTFVINNAADTVVESSSAANDTVESSISSFTLPTNVNTLIVGQSDHGTGNAGNDYLVGTGSGLLTAGSGNDTLLGQAYDSLVAGSGQDILIGTGQTDLYSGSGVDTLQSSTVSGDSLYINNSQDVITSLSSDTLYTSVNYTLAASVPVGGSIGWNLTGSANLTAADAAILPSYATMTFTGNNGHDTLIGGPNSDTFDDNGVGVTTDIGGSVNNLFLVNNVNDVVSAPVGSTDQVTSTVSFSLPTNVNILALQGPSLVGYGNSGPDTMSAGSNSTLVAGSGNDSLISEGSGNRLMAGAGLDTLTGGYFGSDTLVGGTGTDLFVISTAQDIVSVATAGLADTIQSSVSYTLPTNVQYLSLQYNTAVKGTGNSLLDLITGNGGNDTLTAGSGIAALEGGRVSGADVMTASLNQAALIAGVGGATLTGGAYKDFYAAGLIADTITTGATANVISVNKGDGATTLQPTTGAADVLSLGAGIDTESLYLTKTGNNLILTDGVSGDSVTLTNWYAGASDQDVKTLQVVEIASSNYNSGGSDPLRNKPLEEFNFTSLVAAYNAAGSPANWALSTAMGSAQLASSATADYGGDLAYYFGLNGKLTGIDLSAVQSTLTNSSYATGTQTIDSYSSITGGSGLQLLVSKPTTSSGAAVTATPTPTQTSTLSAPATPIASTSVGIAPAQAASYLDAQPVNPTPIAAAIPTMPTTISPSISASDPEIGGTAASAVSPPSRSTVGASPASRALGHGHIPMPRPIDLATLSAVLTPHQGSLQARSVLSRLVPRFGTIFGARDDLSSDAKPRYTEPRNAVGTSVDTRSYVDPVNLAWVRLHGAFDDLRHEASGMEATPEHDMAGTDALTATPPLSRTRRIGMEHEYLSRHHTL